MDVQLMRRPEVYEKKISVITPCHNVSETIRRTWGSLKAQTIGLPALECIFVDDASDDGGKTWEALSEVEAEEPESVVLLRMDENLRQGGARNAGLQYATGEYLLFLDADDALAEEACKSLYEQAGKTDADIIQFRHAFVRDDDSDAPMPKEKPKKGSRIFDLSDDAVRRAFLTGLHASFGCTNKCYRTDLVKKTGSRFAEHRVYEEPKFVYPLFLYAGKVLMTDDGFYTYYWHAGSTMTSKLGDRLLDHPMVQLELLEDLMNRKEMFERYHAEIETQFVFSFYCETILFAKTNHGFLPLDFFRQMQSTCNTVFPNAANNPLLCGITAAVPILPSLSAVFASQEALNTFIRNI